MDHRNGSSTVLQVIAVAPFAVAVVYAIAESFVGTRVPEAPSEVDTPEEEDDAVLIVEPPQNLKFYQTRDK